MQENGFHTLRGYDRLESPEISNAMEDYLEMICRLTGDGQVVRVNQLASLLNVTPPSSSKMVAKLKESGMVEFEPYGIIKLTEQGKELGEYLLYRHDVLQRFLCRLNKTQSELALVEKIEHFFDKRTIENIEAMLRNR